MHSSNGPGSNRTSSLLDTLQYADGMQPTKLAAVFDALVNVAVVEPVESRGSPLGGIPKEFHNIENEALYYPRFLYLEATGLDVGQDPKTRATKTWAETSYPFDITLEEVEVQGNQSMMPFGQHNRFPPLSQMILLGITRWSVGAARTAADVEQCHSTSSPLTSTLTSRATSACYAPAHLAVDGPRTTPSISTLAACFTDDALTGTSPSPLVHDSARPISPVKRRPRVLSAFPSLVRLKANTNVTIRAIDGRGARAPPRGQA
ncbi:hypothetical protein DFH06DRAFT_1477211 [Mycena polygramma]|nr:hypothetical protein DFH06DRAFT_1477211 [Mycena polygramma]